METIADFHLHSRFSRACSRELTLRNLDKSCRVKGVQIIGTGDFTHPEWFAEIEKQLVDIGAGLYCHKEAPDEKIKFILTSEVSLVYSDDVRVRRLHLIIHGPSIEAVRELNKFLGQKYNIKSDGRPILGISAPDFVKLVLSVNPKFLIYPAHIWTPWFSVFGSKSGFNTFEECFREQTPHIYAYETGLSSDPAMNWRVPSLDGLTLLSNSDAHSLNNIGREANILDLDDFTYDEIYEAIKTRDSKKLKGTIEFYPEEGMYHFDGHRDCGVSFSPDEFRKHRGVCPVCGRSLTIGVASRVNELSKRPESYILKNAPGFQKLIELDKIIAQSLGVKSRTSVRVKKIYNEMIDSLGDELSILRTVEIKKIESFEDSSSKLAKWEISIAEAIRRMRAGEVTVKPGFDGQYGEISIL